MGAKGVGGGGARQLCGQRQGSWGDADDVAETNPYTIRCCLLTMVAALTTSCTRLQADPCLLHYARGIVCTVPGDNSI